MPDFDEIMKMAQNAQAELQRAQDNLDKIEVEGVSGGGLVRVRATAKGRILTVAIDESLLKDAPGQIVALNNLAWCYLQVKDKRAVEIAQQAVKLDPKNPALLDTLGWILVHNGDSKRGLEHLKAAAELGVPLVGVGLLYRGGYFRQEIDAGRHRAPGSPFGRAFGWPDRARPLPCPGRVLTHSRRRSLADHARRRRRHATAGLSPRPARPWQE